MKLQIALDMTSIEEAVELVGKIQDMIDIVEIGTPMIIKEGMLPVRKMKERFPHITVLADTKIADGGELEAGYAVEAGADIVTVLAIAADNTILGAKKAVKEKNKELYVDLLSVEDVKKRSQELDQMGVDYIGVHTASDVQGTGKQPFDELKMIKETVKNTKIAVAGGITLDTVKCAKESEPAVVIVGSYLTKSPDVRAAVAALKNAME